MTVAFVLHRAEGAALSTAFRRAAFGANDPFGQHREIAWEGPDSMAAGRVSFIGELDIARFPHTETIVVVEGHLTLEAAEMAPLELGPQAGVVIGCGTALRVRAESRTVFVSCVARCNGPTKSGLFPLRVDADFKPSATLPADVLLGHVAANLLKAGHSVTVWNRSQEPVQALVAKGAAAARTPEDALKGDAVFSMLSNDAVMRDLGLAGPLLEKAAKGLIHVNLATISVAFAKELAAAHHKAGISYISAPVFGRPEMAETAQLVLVAGGDVGALEVMQPVFDKIGARTVALDAAEKANLFKIAGNFMIASELESTGEAFALLRKGGVDPALFHDVLSGRLFTGAVFKNYGMMILNRAYEPAGFALTLGLKDVNLARAAAVGLGMTMPTAELLKTNYDQAVSWGWQDKDWAAIGEVPAKKAGV